MTKKEARKLYKEKRQSLSMQQKDKLEDLMLIQFQSLNLEIPHHVMTFSALEEHNEYDPFLVMEYCRFRNPAVQFSYPIVDGDEMNAFISAEDGAFMKNEYGIEEPVDGIPVAPQEIGLILVPLITFTEEGARVGYGKGYYDRFLAKCGKDILTVGFSFFPPVEKISDTNNFDVPLKACITPEAIFEF